MLAANNPNLSLTTRWRYCMVSCMAMKKTTVYLPDDLKARLEQAAEASARSEADLIREGIELAVARVTPPLPSFGIFASGDGTLSQRVDELLEGFGER